MPLRTNNMLFTKVADVSGKVKGNFYFLICEKWRVFKH